MAVCAEWEATVSTWKPKPAATTSAPETPPAARAGSSSKVELKAPARAAASTVSGLPSMQPPAVPPSPLPSPRTTSADAKQTNEIRAAVSSYVSDKGHNATAAGFLSSPAAFDVLTAVAEADKASVREKLRQCFYHDERSRSRVAGAASAASNPFQRTEAEGWAGGLAVCRALDRLNSVHAEALDPAAFIRHELSVDATTESAFEMMGLG